jgi:hypothetical protein
VAYLTCWTRDKKCFDKKLKELLFVYGKQVNDDGDKDVGFWCVICKRHYKIDKLFFEQQKYCGFAQHPKDMWALFLHLKNMDHRRFMDMEYDANGLIRNFLSPKKKLK